MKLATFEPSKRRRPAARFACSAQEALRSGRFRSKTCRVLHPWLGDAFDKKHGFEAPSAEGGEAEHTGADPNDVQHVSDEMALSDGRQKRTFRTRVLGGHGALAGTGSAMTPHSHASTTEARDFCKQHGLQVSMRVNPRDLGDRAAGISARAWSAKHQIFIDAERAGTLRSDGFPCTVMAHVHGAFRFHRSRDDAGEVERVRQVFRD